MNLIAVIPYHIAHSLVAMRHSLCIAYIYKPLTLYLIAKATSKVGIALLT